MLISVSDLIKQTFKFYFEHFGLILKYLLFVIGTWALIFLNSTFGFNTTLFNSLLGQRISIVFSLVLQLFFLIISYIVLLAFKRGMAHIVRGTIPTSIFREILNTRKIFWKTIGVSIIYGLTVLAGSLLIIVPGIIFALWFYFSQYGVILDNQKPLEAMKNSKTLVAGRFGAVLWRLVAPTFLYVLVFGTVSWAILTPGEYFLAATGSVPVYILTAVLATIFNFLIIPITNLTPILLYEHLKATPDTAN